MRACLCLLVCYFDCVHPPFCFFFYLCLLLFISAFIYSDVLFVDAVPFSFYTYALLDSDAFVEEFRCSSLLLFGFDLNISILYKTIFTSTFCSKQTSTQDE